MHTETRTFLPLCRRFCTVVVCLAATACSSTAPQAPAASTCCAPDSTRCPPGCHQSVRRSGQGSTRRTRHALIAAPVTYRQGLQGMSASEIARERSQLAATTGNPENQMRLALLYAQTRTSTGDPAKALALAETLLKSNDPAAVALQPLAALLVEQLTERVRLEGVQERLQTQGKENQRKIHDLQEN